MYLPSFTAARVCRVDFLIRIHWRISSNTALHLHYDYSITMFQNFLGYHNSGNVRIYIVKTLVLITVYYYSSYRSPFLQFIYISKSIRFWKLFAL